MTPTAESSLVVALARACHPGPTLTVTAAVTLLAASAGRDVAGCLAVLVTVLVGQLSVGWSNDALDAERDAVVGRSGKPTVDGHVTPAVLLRLAIAALAVACALSFAVAGAAGGACHVLFLASAWAYNLGLKSTRLSLVPYAVGFGALPGFVTYGADPSTAPPWWMTAAAGLLGVAAGLANAAPDVDDDRATGVHGAVGRLGARTARIGCVVVLVAATALLAFGSGLAPWFSVLVLTAVVGIGATGLRWREGSQLFPLVLVIALLDVALFAAAA